MNDNIEDLFRGDLFPDLDKAKKARKLTDFIKEIREKDTDIFEIVNEEKKKLEKETVTNFKNFFLSHKNAINKGNQNSCEAKDKYFDIAGQLDSINNQQNPLEMSNIYPEYITDKKKKSIVYPKTRTAGPTTSKKRPPTVKNFKSGQLVEYYPLKTMIIKPIDQDLNSEKSKRNFDNFIRAQAGDRRTTLANRGVVFSENGTPFYGDSYLDRSDLDNLSANLATSTPVVERVYLGTKTAQPIKTKNLATDRRVTIAPKNNTPGNLLALGAVAAAITALMFLIQYVVGIVQFIMNMQLLVSNYTNLSRSFTAILGAVGSLIGLDEDITKPLDETIDGLLNNVFGREKVQ